MRLLLFLLIHATRSIDVDFFDEDKDPVLMSTIHEEGHSHQKPDRFLIYDVNYGEGFNLRRDVYMRVANAVRLLREQGENFVLILPPWGRLYHWTKQETKLSWSFFFDMDSLTKFVPVAEFDEFIEYSQDTINQVVYLQQYAEGWTDEYVKKFHTRPCLGAHRSYRQDGDKWTGWFFSYEYVKADRFQCVSFQGDSETLRDMIMKNFSDVESLMIDRAETVLHSGYGDEFYWEARRSMRYNETLIRIASDFRIQKLNSDDSTDGTKLPEDWRNEVARRSTTGGPYLCAHWRRRDFLSARKSEIPSISGAAEQLNRLAKEKKLDKLYLSTDAPEEEINELRSKLDVEVFKFDNEVGLSDGQIAIIDQIICSRAAYFIGSHESTFSFRIQEDREILGFPVETTFNRLCPDDNPKCDQPTKWTIVY